MQKLGGFPISKSLDRFKSLYGSASGTAKPLSSSISARQSSDSVSSGSFANLKLTAGFDSDFTSIFVFFLLLLIVIGKFERNAVMRCLISSSAEKLVKEQASVKTDLDIAVRYDSNL